MSIIFKYHNYPIYFDSEELPQDGQRMLTYMEEEARNLLAEAINKSYYHVEETIFKVYTKGTLNFIRDNGNFPRSFDIKLTFFDKTIEERKTNKE